MVVVGVAAAAVVASAAVRTGEATLCQLCSFNMNESQVLGLLVMCGAYNLNSATCSVLLAHMIQINLAWVRGNCLIA